MLWGPRKRCGCGAEMVMVQTTSGATMPLDPEPNPERGNVRIIGMTLNATPKAEVIPKSEIGQVKLEPEERYLSHFATCPNAANYRKERR